MRAAGLHAIETVLVSQAVLIRSNKPANEHDPLIERITSRIAGVVAAGKYVLCNYNIPRKVVAEATRVTPGRRAATVSPLDDPEWVAVSSMVLKAEVADVMDKLQVSLFSTLAPLVLPSLRFLTRIQFSFLPRAAGDRSIGYPRDWPDKLPRLKRLRVSDCNIEIELDSHASDSSEAGWLDCNKRKRSGKNGQHQKLNRDTGEEEATREDEKRALRL